ncbi:response regulator [Paenibacillus sp. MAH-34]|uniref:Response regulator n=1 Tax=Paenibacillus anseongense TaxID=2682845 RepID=A0ABW9UJ54_9BACL|nr:response regulator [Paenibacillus anseongense]
MACRLQSMYHLSNRSWVNLDAEGGCVYKALVVDDERIEREGIKFLIETLGLSLLTAEAENGVKAWEYLQAHEVDILFTDIRMPFMDGLALAAKAKKLHPKLKVIIVSAFGDFEYAKQAIQIHVVHYLLKPVEVAEFLEVVTQVVRLCDEDREQRERTLKLQQVYEIGNRYVQEQTLLNLLQGTASTRNALAGETLFEWLDEHARYRVVLMDMRRKFFDSVNHGFEAELKSMLPWDCLYVNLNEYQSVLFLHIEKSWDDITSLESYGLLLQEYLLVKYHANHVLVFSKLLNGFQMLPTEFQEMEKALEHKFFLPATAMMFTEQGCTPRQEEPVYIERLLEEISTYMTYGETLLIRSGIEQMFDVLQNSNSLSNIYVKYICSEIAKKYIQTYKRESHACFHRFVEQIYTTQNLVQLKELMNDLIVEREKPATESTRKVIGEVLKLIHRNYGQDIGLDSLAEKAYLSPSYLSHLFKKETGASLVKYITCYRLEKAGELLRSTTKKISDISQEVGYTNFAYFCSIFKNYYGKTPAKYREGDTA